MDGFVLELSIKLILNVFRSETSAQFQLQHEADCRGFPAAHGEERLNGGREV